MNIHTHLIPGLIWLRNHLPKLSTSPEDLPSLLFTSSALLCLFASAVWHTMSGCAHRAGMELCARLDYVGIGWLISASLGTVVHYGFYCHENLRAFFLSLCVVSAVLGTLFPFMGWFNKFEYRVSVSCPQDVPEPADSILLVVPDRLFLGTGILSSRSFGLHGPSVRLPGDDILHL